MPAFKYISFSLLIRLWRNQRTLVKVILRTKGKRMIFQVVILWKNPRKELKSTGRAEKVWKIEKKRLGVDLEELLEDIEDSEHRI